MTYNDIWGGGGRGVDNSESLLKLPNAPQARKKILRKLTKLKPIADIENFKQKLKIIIFYLKMITQ